ncbi:MAG TPA: hypothetical protein ENG42_02210 [Candidatus Aenigmarchaeota archaeon]|nr:hypothetical protein [Candidatus Aenigmarchaeota archaeon]
MIIKVNSTSTSNISAEITGTQNASFEIPGSIGMIEYSYLLSLPSGTYTLTLKQGSDSVSVEFKIVKSRKFMKARLIGDGNVIFVDTSNEITAGNEFGGNFTELLTLSKSKKLHYGVVQNLDGKNYSFVLVDESRPGIYDSIWVDDDKLFLLYNSSEDSAEKDMVETRYTIGEKFLKKYVFIDTEVESGNKLIITPLLNRTYFSKGDIAHFLVTITNESAHFLPNQSFILKIFDDKAKEVYNYSNSTNNNGYFVVDYQIPANSPTGAFFVTLNDTPTEVFVVESFKLFVKITDLNNNPSYTFAPKSKIKIWVITKDSNDNFFNATTLSGKIFEPKGTSVVLSFTQSDTGRYYAEYKAMDSGKYKVVVEVSDASGDKQKMDAAFEVQKISFIAMTVNPKYIDEAEAGPEVIMINTFAPGSSVTIATFIRDITKLSGEGGPCAGNACMDINCSNKYYKLKVFDDKKNMYDVNFTVMNISALSQMFGKEPPEEPGVAGQCIILIWNNNSWINTTGNYKVDIEFNHPVYGKHYAGEAFGIQYLYATGGMVDMKGDEFTFIAPSSTARIKLKIRDLITDEYIPDNNIINVEITEMRKEWPEFKDALGEMQGYNKSMLNESVNGSVITFFTPPEEGFYIARIRFKVNLSSKGIIAEGTGTVFFELKKYFIWAEPKVSGDMKIIGQGSNITLQVYVMDIDKAVRYGKMTPECTGCSGYVVTVERLRNDQIFKEFKKGLDFNVTDGVIINSTSGAEVKIVPVGKGLPSGWYSVDLSVYDPATNKKYYGWGWFEIRNFFAYAVPVKPIEGQAGNYSIVKTESLSYPTTSNVLLGVIAFKPGGEFQPPLILNVESVSIESIQNFATWPPQVVEENKYKYNGFVSNARLFDESGFEIPGTKIINISFYNMKNGNYMLNLLVQASGMKDIGTGMLQFSNYNLKWNLVPEDKLYEWPIIYSPSENMTFEFNATEFDGSPHNLSSVEVSELFDENKHRPVRMKVNENYTYSCALNYCQLNVSLKNLKTGEYGIRVCVRDAAGDVSCVQHLRFEIRSFILGVPMIYEYWMWQEKDTPDNTLYATKSGDNCDNSDYLAMDECPQYNKTICIWGCQVNISLPFEEKLGKYYGGVFWIEKEWSEKGKWRMGNQGPVGVYVYVVSNTTHLWINTSTDPNNGNLAGSKPLAIGDTFTLNSPGVENYEWLVYAVAFDGNNSFRVKHANGIICGDTDDSGEQFRVVPPKGHANYSTFYHGYTQLVNNNPISWRLGLIDHTSPNYNPRFVYIYHNTTHLWIVTLPISATPSNTIVNFTDPSVSHGPVPIGSVIDDGHGGKWKITSITKETIKLYGQNVLSSGIFVDTSLSKSGKFVFFPLEEGRFAMEAKLGEGEGKGFDLDGDGYYNGTLYMLVIDNGTSYNTIAYSKDYNFTNASRIVSVGNDRDKRRIGLKDTLILLSIDPRVNRVFFYTDRFMGEWPELGDYRINTNITIPVMVTDASNNPISANVTIGYIKYKSATGSAPPKPVSYPWKTITGVDELEINTTQYGFGTGNLEFGIVAKRNGEEEFMEEWKWPKATVRAFLIDTHTGYGKVFSNKLVSTKLWRFAWDTGLVVLPIYIANTSNYPIIKGVVAFVGDEQIVNDPQAECNFVMPADADPNGTNLTYKIKEFENMGALYYIYLNKNNVSKAWIKKDDCNFTGITAKSEGDQINISIQGNLFMLYLLNASENRISIGLLNFEPSNFTNSLPIRYESRLDGISPIWYLISANISGKVYDVVLMNSTASYPICNVWMKGGECVKVAVFDSDGNMSSYEAYVKAGESIGNTGYYLASIGPTSWDGVMLGNASVFGSWLPIIWIHGMADNAPVYIAKLNESEIGFDLNLDDALNMTFYMLAYDDMPDGQQKPTRIIIDDDNQFVEFVDWSTPGNETYYDMYGDESGAGEVYGNMPMGIWHGWVAFGDWQSIAEWENRPEFELIQFDTANNKIRLMKNVWQIKEGRNATIMVKVYNFDQSPIAGATVSIDKMYRFGFTGPSEINVTAELNYQADSVSDSDGYYMIYDMQTKTGPLSAGDYVISLRINAYGNEEIEDVWFNVGGGKP